jgi:protein-L-isoaspartate(D-aspartate) O-methyltransferase
MVNDDYCSSRNAMVDAIAERGSVRRSVLEAMRDVPRHEFVPEYNRHLAYADRAVSIGHMATISQPYMVAYMTEAADITNEEQVLEVGTGSGYQAAVLAALGADVFSVEINAELAERARVDLARLGYVNAAVKAGDGYSGWPEHAPFDAIVVTAATPLIPEPLVEQLAEYGRLVIPLGDADEPQVLKVYEKVDGLLALRKTTPVRFIPMIGLVSRATM